MRPNADFCTDRSLVYCAVRPIVKIQKSLKADQQMCETALCFLQSRDFNEETLKLGTRQLCQSMTFCCL